MSKKFKVPEVQLLKEEKRLNIQEPNFNIPPPSFEASLYCNTARISLG